jgi:hypothetical protein
VPKRPPMSEIFPCFPGFEIIHVGLGGSPIPTFVGPSLPEAVSPKWFFGLSDDVAGETVRCEHCSKKSIH